MDIQFDSVYFKKQERRPFEIYYTQKLGVVAFKVSSTELWTIRQDTINNQLSNYVPTILLLASHSYYQV